MSQAQETTTESATSAGSTAAPQETTPAEESTKSPPEESSTTSGPEESSTSGSQTTDGPAQSECENLQSGQYAFICPTGFRRHPRYCNRFYQCTEKDDSEVNVLTFNCPENTTFDNNQQQCLPVGMCNQIYLCVTSFYEKNLISDEAEKCNGETAQERPPSSRSRNFKAAVS
jgi:hypothetical protein